MEHTSKEIESPVYDERGRLLYGVVRNMISKDLAERMVEYIEKRFRDGRMHHDNQCPASLSIMNPFCWLQQQLTWNMCDFFKKNLCPTYNYCRHYVPDDVLERHRDRQSCQYSMTLSLGREGDIWPFFAQYKDFPETKIMMDVGDCTIYRGCAVDHWRDANEYGIQHQTFLHYIDLNGPYREFAYDSKHRDDYSKFFKNMDRSISLDYKKKKPACKRGQCGVDTNKKQ